MSHVTLRPSGRRSTHAYYEVAGLWAGLFIDFRSQRFRLNDRGRERAAALLRLYVERAGAYAAEAPEHPWRCSWVVGEERIEAEGLLAQDARDCLMRLLAIVEDPRAQTTSAIEAHLPAQTLALAAAAHLPA